VKPTRPGPARPARIPKDADRFRLMADFAPVLVWMSNAEGRFVFVNRTWVEFTGRALGDELGTGWTERLHPDDREHCREVIERHFAARLPFEVEYRLRRADGRYRWLLAKGVPLLEGNVLDGYVGSCIDITDRLAAEHEARRREEDFRNLAENIPDAIARVDRALRCVYANRAIEWAFGRKPRDALGKALGELAAHAEVVEPLVAAAHAAFESGEEQRFRIDEPGGAHRRFAGRAIAELREGGNASTVLLIIYDVTASIEAEKRREVELACERTARADAESASIARDQFLAIVSHELRSPLNGIKSWTHVLQNVLRNPDPTAARAIDGIMIGVEHQVRLIDDLLDVTRALSGNLGLAKQPMALVPVLAEATEGLRALAAEKSLQVVTRYAGSELEMRGDPDRIRQVFSNLLANAIKFTPNGGTVWISAVRQDAMACVEVRDTGAGIAPEFLPYVFDAFRQADQGASNRRQEGLGLGLALVKRLTELHGGYVTCESGGAGLGATFRVFLPLSPEEAGAVSRWVHEPNAMAALPSLSGTTVLMIDDQREARESVTALLLQAGAEVVACASAEEAVAKLGEGPELTVIVCDIAMPGEDGYAALKRIRSWESERGSRRRPAIALSAFSERRDRARARSEGFQTYLTKPVAPAELIHVVATAARGMRV